MFFSKKLILLFNKLLTYIPHLKKISKKIHKEILKNKNKTNHKLREGIGKTYNQKFTICILKSRKSIRKGQKAHRKLAKDVNSYFTVKNTQTVNKYLKKFTIALATKDRQIKTSVSCNFISIRPAKLKNLAMLNNMK